jgi:rhomboid protease GluP
MFSLTEYQAWQITHDLIKNHHFHLIQVDERNYEIWLQGKINKSSVVIRLYSKGFDWANHLKKDIAFAIERVRKIQKLIQGRVILLYNVYIAQYHPVDYWESLKKAITLRDKKTIITTTFYIDQENTVDETNRLYEALSSAPPVFDNTIDESQLQIRMNQMKQDIIQTFQKRKQEAASIFSYGKTIFTYIFIAINLIIFGLMEYFGSSRDALDLIEWGAKFNPYIIDGEWWRIISSMFIHIGFLHIAMNMIALYYLGSAVERMYGSLKFFIIYIMSGIVGSLISFALNTNVAAGASGAIFGLFGALLYFGLTKRNLFAQTIGSNLIFVIVLNIVLGFTIPNIDMYAHLGGLFGGFLVSAIVQLPKQKIRSYQIIGMITYLAIIISLAYYGIQENESIEDPQINYTLGYMQNREQDYESAVESLTLAIQFATDNKDDYYFERSYSYIFLEEWEKARDDLLKALEINDRFPEAHHNLAIVYEQLNDKEKAAFHADKAAELRAN